MALTRQQLSKFYADRKPFLEEIIGLNFKEHPTIWSQFINTKSASTGWVDTATVSGFGTFSSKPELEDAATDDILQGPVARTTIVTYAKRHLVSQEAIEDDLGDGIIASRLPKMMAAGRATQEILAHDLLNNTGTWTPDSVTLFSASHKNLSGTTYSNLTTGDLANSTLEAAITLLQTQVDDRNIPIMQMASKLVIHPNFEFTARELLESTGSTAFVANSNSGVINTTKGIAQLIVTPYITNADDWFLFGDQHDLNFRWRIQPENWSEPDYVKSALEIGVRFRCAVEALDPRGVVGSRGAT